ncbi:MAG: bifunctional oligoribonuclease/PAP phosphatase NrnA [Spirochaetaceae bacterium]|jgi:phosphoesterase RecJ-like protein|nr:bifunctional oligoribonuclease/PAP phosphatase NrnA [Spirochaetaceae bacterium]
MRSLPVPQSLIRFINEGDAFIVAGHKEPDGDCVGSQLALCSFLRRLGKKATACSAGPFKRTEILPYAGSFSAAPGQDGLPGARVIVTDCSDLERTGDLKPFLEGFPLAIIDHHATGKAGEADYLDIHAPSVTFMIAKLIEAFGETPSREEAALLFFGLCTDTGFFRHTGEGEAETFFRAAKLIEAGASPKKTFLAINGNRNLDSRILMGLVLARVSAHYNGKLLASSETYEDTRRFGLEGRDSDALYQLLQSVRDVECIMIVRQESPGRCTVGLRSRDAVDVSRIAEKYGGGGHKNAAGLSVDGVIADVFPMLVAEFKEALEN